MTNRSEHFGKQAEMEESQQGGSEDYLQSSLASTIPPITDYEERHKGDKPNEVFAERPEIITRTPPPPSAQSNEDGHSKQHRSSLASHASSVDSVSTPTLSSTEEPSFSMNPDDYKIGPAIGI